MLRQSWCPQVPSIRFSEHADVVGVESRFGVKVAGLGLHAYVRSITATTRFTPVPPGTKPWEREPGPFIALTWYGQPMLMPAVLSGAPRTAVLASLHFDGRVAAEVARRAGLAVIRGSGANERSEIVLRRGVPAFFAMRDALRGGTSLVLTADTPERTRQAGHGVLHLARATQRPLFLFAAVASPRLELDGRKTVALPFGRGCVLWSDPIQVPQNAGETTFRVLAARIEDRLDDLHAEAYGCLAAGIA